MKKVAKYTINILIIVAFTTVLALVGCTPQFTPTPAPAPYGHYCSLQEAYDAGKLTLEQLESIAWYNHDQTNRYNETQIPADFQPIPRTLGALTDEMAFMIRNDYYYYDYYLYMQNEAVSDAANPDASPDRVRLCNYLGTYNGGVVVYVTAGYFVRYSMSRTIQVAGVNYFCFDTYAISRPVEQLIVWYPPQI